MRMTVTTKQAELGTEESASEVLRQSITSTPLVSGFVHFMVCLRRSSMKVLYSCRAISDIDPLPPSLHFLYPLMT